MARVLYYNRLINEPFGGGTHARGLLKGIRALGHDAAAYPAEVPGGVPCSTVGRYARLPQAVRVPALDVRARFRSASERESLGALVRNFRPNVIVARRTAYDYTLDSLIGWCAAPVVAEMNALLFYEASVNTGEYFLPWERVREAGFVMRARRAVCVSEAVAAQLIAHGLHPLDLRVIPNGVDETEIRPGLAPSPELTRFARGAEGVVGYCGTLSANHDPELLAEAAKQILDSAPCTRFVWVGPSTEDLREHGFSEEVLGASMATGTVGHDAVAGYLGTSDVLWAALRRDHGSPLKLYEYLAMGIPTVAAAGAQVEAVLAESSGGISVPRGDGRALAQAVVATLAASRSERRRIGACGREWVLANATWTSVASRMLDGLV